MIEVRERPKVLERALLVGLQYPRQNPDEAEGLLAELKALVATDDIGVAHSMLVKIRRPQPRFLLGKGKTAEIIELAKDHECGLIVLDGDLSPAQQRNWEKESGLCVIDRREVILDIFSKRARTREAVLQVELAHMYYSLPRLKRAWTHLSRQRGGGTTQRGEGEAQIELDQRLVRTRIARLKRELVEVVRRRGVQRQKRLRVPVPTAAIVGYTNAGKSSLLNRLTGSKVFVEDKLFATLDPTTRRLTLPSGRNLLLTDTVGFLRRLPHQLIEAFKATLEETVVSDFLIHVLDLAHPDVDLHHASALEVLEEIGADSSRILTVYNKIDLLDGSEGIRRNHKPTSQSVCVSAATGEGFDELLDLIESMIEADDETMEMLIPHDRYDLVSRLHKLGCVKKEESIEEGIYLVGIIPNQLAHHIEPFLLNDSETLNLSLKTPKPIPEINIKP